MKLSFILVSGAADMRITDSDKSVLDLHTRFVVLLASPGIDHEIRRVDNVTPLYPTSWLKKLGNMLDDRVSTASEESSCDEGDVDHVKLLDKLWRHRLEEAVFREGDFLR